MELTDFLGKPLDAPSGKWVRHRELGTYGWILKGRRDGGMWVMWRGRSGQNLLRLPEIISDLELCEEPELHLADLRALADIALDTDDREWFKELSARISMHAMIRAIIVGGDDNELG